MIKKKERNIGIVEGFLSGVPVFGKFLKELAKTETFQERFKEVDEKIKENLEKGIAEEGKFEAKFSIHPILREVKKDMPKIVTVREDHIYGKKEDKLVLAVKVPKEDVNLEIKGKNLIITAEKFEKKIELPGYFKNIKKKKYKNGFLLVELEK